MLHIKDFLTFVKRIIINSSNIFSVIGYLVFLITILVPLTPSVKTNTLIFSAAFALFSSSYFTWKESYKLIPKAGDLKYKVKEVILDSSGAWTRGLPTDVIAIKLIIDFQNRGPEKIILNNIEKEKLRLNTNIFEVKEKVNYFYEMVPNIHDRNNRIEFPIDISGRDHKLIQYEMHLNMNKKEIDKIVTFIKEAENFFIKLYFNYSTIDGDDRSDKIFIERSYNQFKIKLKEFIKSHNRNDILVLLNNENDNS